MPTKKTEEKKPKKTPAKAKAEDAQAVDVPQDGPVKLPPSLGACADLYADLRDDRLAKDRESAVLERKEKFVKTFLTTRLAKGDDRGAVGRHHRVHVESEDVYQVEDWEKFYAHIKKTGDFTLLNRALNSTAVEEQIAAGKKIPGVRAVPVLKLRLHKLS